MIQFEVVEKLPEGIKLGIPSNAKFVGWARLDGCSSEQYKLYRDLGRTVTGFAPLMESEVSGASLGFENEENASYYMVVGG